MSGVVNIIVTILMLCVFGYGVWEVVKAVINKENVWKIWGTWLVMTVLLFLIPAVITKIFRVYGVDVLNYVYCVWGVVALHSLGGVSCAIGMYKLTRNWKGLI